MKCQRFMQIQLAPFQCKITMTHRNPFLHPFLAHCVVTRAHIAAKSRRSRNSFDQWSPVPFLPFLFHMQWIQPKHNVMILTSASSSPLFKFKKELQQIVGPLFQIPLALTWCFPHVFSWHFLENSIDITESHRHSWLRFCWRSTFPTKAENIKLLQYPKYRSFRK